MPTAAIYVVLSVILAPAIVEMGVSPIAAHLFIFYFGLLSFLTPPVAIASFVAAGLAGSRMWLTSWVGVQLAAVAYFLPFLWSFNDALLLQGSLLANTYAVGTALVAVLLIARALQTLALGTTASLASGLAVFGGALVVGSSTVWLGQEAALTVAAAGIGLGVLVVFGPGGKWAFARGASP